MKAIDLPPYDAGEFAPEARVLDMSLPIDALVPAGRDRLVVIPADGCAEKALAAGRKFREAGVFAIAVAPEEVAGMEESFDAVTVVEPSAVGSVCRSLCRLVDNRGPMVLGVADIIATLKGNRRFRLLEKTVTAPADHLEIAADRVFARINAMNISECDRMAVVIAMNPRSNLVMTLRDLSHLSRYIRSLAASDVIMAVQTDEALPYLGLRLTVIVSGEKL